MNFAMIFRILGWMMMFEAAFMAPSGVAAEVASHAAPDVFAADLNEFRFNAFRLENADHFRERRSRALFSARAAVEKKNLCHFVMSPEVTSYGVRCEYGRPLSSIGQSILETS